MARYKPYDYSQMKFLPVSFKEQILPGSFEYTLNQLIDREVDLSVFEERYRNAETGAPAYDPAILLKIILYAYSRGVTSSREIARLCRENVVFMALSADSAPHFTTIADFIATLDAEIGAVFRDVLLVCDEAGLIGREMFAVDGVKLPSNAAKAWSGTRADFGKKVEKMERAVRYLVRRHRQADAEGEEEALRAARRKQIKTLKRAVAKVKGFLAGHEDKLGASGRVKKSNVTDNESAKMKTGKGVIQGYDGLAVVDAKHQVVVHAEAHGEAQEHGLFVPALEGTRQSFRALGGRADVLKQAAVAADAGFHSEANVRFALENGIDAYVADTLFRSRDPRFATVERHRPQRAAEPWARPPGLGLFKSRDFRVAEDLTSCLCPAGKRLYRNGRHCDIRGFEAVKFTGAKRDCGPCELRTQCLRHPERTPVRQVAIFLGRLKGKPETWTSRMKRKIDSEQGRYQYSRRLGIVEPVFANICHAHQLRRFSLRGRRKVNTQWLLYCLVHNIGKVQRYGNIGKRAPRSGGSGSE
ncbi:MAG: IS1182 family transposase [Candidatus Hydrogenedentes bacterium]|nr:IS1182 family transposase [Candidatus Hydrogenedentota bacterium]